ncbi:GOLPH3/VPS74 family protein [Prauserella cavernicola]|uniref:GPP34 family phosphoprotein n=1 Tax=Prauserella cavernicola TaxID=2800127 RepID=A0A934QVL0_9PSEU|nr:GPP34 family phosphoprotein [Prauserella cavernicola]MBK1787356.1 GPP34 family phosphoprotein [Prauserella cavernicola]
MNTTSPEPPGDGEEQAGDPSLAEDLLLLLFQPASGTIAGENTLFYPLAGAVLSDLGLAGRLTADGTNEKAEAVGEAPPADELLRSAWTYAAEKPRSVQTVLAAIGPRLRAPLLDRLIARGDIRQVKKKAFGLFNTTALVEGTTGRRAALLESVRAVLVDGGEPTARVGALVALLSASGTLPQFDPHIPWSTPVITRAKQLEQGDWGAGAAAEAVTRTMTAIIANNVIAAATTQAPNR